MAVAPGVDLDNLQPETRNALMTARADLDKAGISYTITSGARSYAAQAALYANRFTNPNPVAPPGSSKHESGLAVDISVPPAQRGAATQILAQHGLSWYGPGDPVHYTYTGPGLKNAMPDLSVFNPPATTPTPAADLSVFNAPAAAAPKPAAPVDLSVFNSPAAKAPTADLSVFNPPAA